MPPEIVTSPEDPDKASPLETRTDCDAVPPDDETATSLPLESSKAAALSDIDPPEMESPFILLAIDTEPSPASTDTSDPPNRDKEPPTKPEPAEIVVEPPTPVLLSPDDTDTEPPTDDALAPALTARAPTAPEELDPVARVKPLPL